MDDVFKKLVNAGIGAAVLAKKKLDETVDDLVDRGKMSEEEGKKIMDSFRKEAEKSTEDAKKEIRDAVREMLDKMDIPSKEEMENIEKRVAALEKKGKDQ